MAVPSPPSAPILLLSPEQISEFRSSRSVKTTSPSSTAWSSRKFSVPSGAGRKSGVTIFWILWGILRYAFWLDRYPGSP